MQVSILMPSRNGEEFLKWAYDSIRKNQGNHEVEILVLDDVSDKDSTWQLCEEIMLTDPMFKAFRNKGNRLGISGGYKFLSQQATNDVICHWHNDMYMTEGALDAIEKHLYTPESFPYHSGVVCLTRIEPPIYNSGHEKIVWPDGPVELDQWNEAKFIDFLPVAQRHWGNKTTGGHFAPFFMFRDEYLKLGGNDIDTFPLQAREDSDWAFRLVLAGFETVQIPHFVYHFASRGNRRSKHETDSFTDNPAWVDHNVKATRNFIRKWQTFNLHDEFLKPRRPVRYNRSLVIENCTYNLMANLEPWFDRIEVDLPAHQIIDYIESEQLNTIFDLNYRIGLLGSKFADNLCDNFDIVCHIDGRRFDGNDFYNIQTLSEIITENDPAEGEEFVLGNLRLKVNRKKTYEHNLIVVKNDAINL